MRKSSKPKVIAVVGPTATGKTSLAVTLAEHFAGEIISADSRQVYRGLDIGTAKVTPEEKRGVPHHLIDITDIDTIYTAADFVRDADQAIEHINSQGHLPIVAGGTFFYVELLRRTMHPAPVPPNHALRAELEAYSTEQLFTLLQEKDAQRAATVDPYNRRRVMRSLEIIDALGTVPPTPTETSSPYDFCLLGITRDKTIPRERFAIRAREWLRAGLVAEVEGLLARGVSRARLQEIGFEYTLVLELIDGTLTPDTFTQRFVEKNWQYAKRQLTWLQRDPTITWIDPDDTNQAMSIVSAFLSPE